MNKPLDPIALEIGWNGLKSIADECFITIMRSAFSTNIKERHDHSTAIADAKGRLIAQAEMALPIHLASMAGLMRHLLDQYGEDIWPGDIFIAMIRMLLAAHICPISISLCQSLTAINCWVSSPISFTTPMSAGPIRDR